MLLRQPWTGLRQCGAPLTMVGESSSAFVSFYQDINSLFIDHFLSPLKVGLKSFT